MPRQYAPARYTIRRQIMQGGLERFYWIAADAPEDAPWGDEDAEEAINRDAKAKLAQIQPHRDWSQFWLPVKKAA